MTARAIIRAPRQRDLSTVAAIMNRIEDPAARKVVILNKLERGVITDEECAALIELCGCER